MVEVDRLMVGEIGVSLLQMMENAGGALASHVLEEFGPASVSVLAGGGGNGGGAMAAARHLANRGVEVTVVRSSSRETGAAAVQSGILTAMGIPMLDDPISADVILDGMVGYSLEGPPRGRVEYLIDWASSQHSPVVSLDLPSGVDADVGYAYPSAICPAATVTLALPKPGLGDPRAGTVVLADISVPTVVWSRLGIDVPPRLFGSGRTVALERDGDGFVAPIR